MQEKILVTVFRFDPDDSSGGRYETYEVPYFSHMDVIDVLRYIRDNIDHSLAFRYSCEEGKCGLCSVVVNGKPVLACKRTVQKGESLTIEPLPNFPIIRDLIVDRDGYYDELKHLQNVVEIRSSRKARIAQDKETDYIECANCVECGVCSVSCPAALTGDHPLTGPVGFLQSVRVALFGPSTLSPDGASDLFNCLQCGQCHAVCPRDVNLPELIRRSREQAKDLGLWPKGIAQLLARLNNSKTLLASGNKGPLSTAGWLKSADATIASRAQKKGSAVGLFVGCQFGLRTALQPTIIRFAELLLHAGVDFTFLGTSEWCCGHPSYVAGDVGAAKVFAEHNIHEFDKLGVDTIVTACPGCYRAWKYEYPALIGKEHGFKVWHSSELLLNLMRKGSLVPRRVDGRLTYHDPCELGRLSGILDQPRAIIEEIPGIELIEMSNSRELSHCCGGGGLTPAANPDLAFAVAKRRVEECLSLGVSTIVAACPNCEVTLNSVIRKCSFSGLKVVDIIDVVYNAIREEEKAERRGYSHGSRA